MSVKKLSAAALMLSATTWACAAPQDEAEKVCTTTAGVIVKACVDARLELPFHTDATLRTQAEQRAARALADAEKAAAIAPRSPTPPTVKMPEKPDPTGRSPLERYQAEVEYALAGCQIEYQMARLTADTAARARPQGTSLPPYPQCMQDNKQSVKAPFDALLKSLKKQAAKDALKSVQVAFISAMDGIAPRADEIRIDYSRRQSALRAELDRAWARFEVER